ncbi:GAF domain-containing protein [Sphingomonas yunnanensis]|uniref:GAF domain-containing protein n=1 Tax=Sphingomonas yunnanensis TaxID=310400 RepID=UPI001CA639A5|nr:GAF domain-containing protein [Sphingomonas yunnanensis]MBY9064860.1 GAF domain-containing protein [Sphingomonas yunnanensis]
MRLWSSLLAPEPLSPTAARARRPDWERLAEDLDEIAAAAAGLIGTPAALVTIVDERLWVAGRFNSRLHGLERDECVCAHGMIQPERVLCVPDLEADARFARLPIAQGPDALRFYVGAALVDAGGRALGMLCAMDQRPRAAPSEPQCRALQRLARGAAMRLGA